MGVAALADAQAFGLPKGYYYRFFKKWDNDETFLKSAGKGIFQCLTSKAIYRCPGPGCAAPPSIKRQRGPFFHVVFCPLAKYKGKSIYGQSYSDFLSQQKYVTLKRMPPSVSQFFKRVEETALLRTPNRTTKELLVAQRDSPKAYHAALEPTFSPGEKVQILYCDGCYWWPGVVKKKYEVDGICRYACEYDDGDQNDHEIIRKTAYQLRPFVSDAPVPADDDLSTEDGSCWEGGIFPPAIANSDSIPVLELDSSEEKTLVNHEEGMDSPTTYEFHQETEFNGRNEVGEDGEVEEDPDCVKATDLPKYVHHKSGIRRNSLIRIGNKVVTLRETRRDVETKELLYVLVGQDFFEIITHSTLVADLQSLKKFLFIMKKVMLLNLLRFIFLNNITNVFEFLF